MQMKDSAQETWFNKVYKSRIELSNNYTDLRPITSLIFTMLDWENGLSYIKRIQQDLYDKNIIPFMISSMSDFNKLQSCPKGQVKELLGYIWRGFLRNKNK